MLVPSKKRAIEAAMAYRKGSRELQVALQYVVAQAHSGNADAVHEVFVAAGLLFNLRGELEGTRTAKAVWSYLTAKAEGGGCEIGGMIRFDKDTNRVKMAKGWKTAAAKVDVAQVWANLAEPRGWLEFRPMPKAAVFDLHKAVVSLVKKAEANGQTISDVLREMETVIKAA